MHNVLVYLSLIILLPVSACKRDPLTDTGSIWTTSTVDDFVRPRHFLSSDQYDRLVIEIQYVKEFEPTVTALNGLKTFLDQRINKPEGIEITEKEEPSPGKVSYSLSDIEANENASRIRLCDQGESH